jgi:hypothetical protein
MWFNKTEDLWVIHVLNGTRGTTVTTWVLSVGSLKLKDELIANKYIVIVIIHCHVGTSSTNWLVPTWMRPISLLISQSLQHNRYITYVMSHTTFTFLTVCRSEKGNLFHWLSPFKLAISIGLIQDLPPQSTHFLLPVTSAFIWTFEMT